MDERPRPDIEQTREALRRHDERTEEPVEESEPTEREESGSDDSDEE